MTLRRCLVVSIAAGCALGLAILLDRVLAPGGPTLPKLLMVTGFAGAMPWTGLCLANGLIGWVLMLRRCQAPATRRAPPLAQVPLAQVPLAQAPLAQAPLAQAPLAQAPLAQASLAQVPLMEGPIPPTAIALTVRNEDLRVVLPPAGQLLEDLGAAAPGATFALFILSDTTDPARARAEMQAVEAFRRQARGRVEYRRRTVNTGFKAGNLMDFLDHHAVGFELALVLDADSRMTAAAVLRLVRAMQADSSLGIVQHLVVGLPTDHAFPRLFQFGMRAGMRTWATALPWWQADECVYWGHNALLRIAPFRTHARLPALPDGRPILSHDQVEAAVLRGAGWGIRLLPEEDGSAEATPPALPEFQRREMRWLAGNLEYLHLLRLPGLRPMGRWQLLQATLMFASTPFYLLFLVGAELAALTDRVSPFPAGPALALTLGWTGALYAPKLLGYLQVLLQPRQSRRYGGPLRVLLGIALETLFTLQLDAISLLSKSLGILQIACGARTAWMPQNRSGREVAWAEAMRLFWPHTIVGCAVLAGFAVAGWTPLLWAAPFTAGLAVAVPFCVWTADPRLGSWLQRHRLAAVPEELTASPGGS